MSANNVTPSSRQTQIYSDFTDEFLKAPFSDDLAKTTNQNSVKQSLRNICKTFIGERPYDNTIGQSGNYGLFGLNDSLTESIVTQTLTDAINQNEPRVSLLNITVDSSTIPNAMSITISFNVLNIIKSSTLNK
jgi:phage baseplate assembly protein W